MAEFRGPQPGPQMTLATTSADVAVFGGSAGGGKSVALLYEGAKLTALPRARSTRSVFFRRREVDLLRGGGLWDKAEWMFPKFGGRPKRGELEWVFEAASGRIEDRHRIELRHLNNESDRFAYDGSEYDLVGFDELQQFTAAQFWYLLARLRSTTGLRPRMRASCNPLPDSWLAELVAWWIGEDGYAIPERSGVVRWFVRDEEDDHLHWFDSEAEAVDELGGVEPMSFTFIVSSLDDNPALKRADQTYERRLRGMMRADRMRLLGEKDAASGRDRGGNWHDHAESGGFFDRKDFVIVDAPPSPIVATVRGWDRGASAPTPKHPNPDFTEGARVSVCERGELYIDDLVYDQRDPVETFELVRSTARADGPRVEVGIFQDVGGAGKTDAHLLQRALDGYAVTIVQSDAADQLDPKPKEGASRAKRALAKTWAGLVRQRRVYLRRASWNARVLHQAHRFPLPGTKDDAVDAISCAVQVLDLGSESFDFVQAMESIGRVR